jgi:hypothetical protein
LFWSTSKVAFSLQWWSVPFTHFFSLCMCCCSIATYRYVQKCLFIGWNAEMALRSWA